MPQSARTLYMKPDRVSAAVALIGPPWNTCLDERCRRAARTHMAVLASQDDGKLGTVDLAVQGLRSVGVLARRATHGATGEPQLVVPSDQWAKAYA